MKLKKPILRAAIILGLTITASQAATVFSFQQGDLRRDGALFGSGATYSGTLDGSINDHAPTSSMTAITGDRVGNTFRGESANVGSNGQQWTGLFTINLTELATFVGLNPGYTLSEASFVLTRTGGTAGSTTLGLYQTTPFTGSATWGTSDGTNA